jgi:hypothetical protein
VVDWWTIPALVRHSTLAIMSKSTSGGPRGFLKALRISRDTLAKQGYIYHGKGLSVLQGIHLTEKGWLRNRKHHAEGKSGEAKDRQFAMLWQSIKSKIPEVDGRPNEKGEPDKPKRESKNQTFDDRPGGLYPPPK